MIKGLFETHVPVENLERSIQFYTEVLGLQQCHYEAGRRIAFFWIGGPGQAMLGLWEKPQAEIERRHFAFRCERDFILTEAVPFLKRHQLRPYSFLQDGLEQPMVFAWMPALAIYFDDPDGHHLEFIAMLEGAGRPELGVVPYGTWLEALTR